jgi:hypothetical protein
MKWEWGTVLVGVLIAAAKSELHDPLDTNVQGFKIFSDNAFRHLFPEILYQHPQAAILRKEV